MARGIYKLTPQQVKSAKKAVGDGGGLWLVPKGKSKQWSYRYSFNGKSREMGLGSTAGMTLVEARERADRYRKILKQEKRDPIEVRKEEEAEKNRVIPTFTQAAARYILTHRHEWKNHKHRYQWVQTMRNYAGPVIGDKQVTEITTEDILAVLSPIWTTKTETAKRTQKRIENILDWARVMKYREGGNPARWQGYLDQLLSSPNKIQKVRHQPAMPYGDVAGFYRRLEMADGRFSVRALQFLILTATRSGEARNATWDEIDLEERVWIIPEERMKANKQHRVPLTDEVLSLLESLPRTDDFLFPGRKEGKPISDMTMRMQMRRMECGQYVPHGFRSSFRDWAAEQTSFPREVAERALAHVLENKVEAAYQRGDMFERRRRMMEAWSKFVMDTVDGNVVELLA